MNTIKFVFNFLNNRKTVIGGVIAFIAGGLFTLGLIDQNLFDVIIKWDLLVLGIGIGHKVVKAGQQVLK